MDKLDDVTILLVEDEPQAAKWVRLSLEERGAKVVWATRIDQARALVDQHHPQLAILDVALPDGNGLDLIVELRTGERPCACVVMTGNAESGVARIAAGLGVSDFLAKPVELARLHEAVDQALIRTRDLRRFLAEHRGQVVQREIDGAVVERFAAVREQAPPATADPGLRVAALAAEFNLSARQAQAVAGVAEGLSDAEIAQALQVSYSRTRQLLAAGFAKLGLKSRNDFIRFLWERG